jgi:hypothetical protein
MDQLLRAATRATCNILAWLTWLEVRHVWIFDVAPDLIKDLGLSIQTPNPPCYESAAVKAAPVYSPTPGSYLEQPQAC